MATSGTTAFDLNIDESYLIKTEQVRNAVEKVFLEILIIKKRTYNQAKSDYLSEHIHCKFYPIKPDGRNGVTIENFWPEKPTNRLKQSELEKPKKEPGIDFTLSAPHEVVPVLSAINHFNETPWLAWRTAFREIVKLLTQQTPTVESKYRLKKWCDLGTGKNAEWVYCAANDAKEFVESNDDIMKTYNFKWLKNFYEQKYG